MPTVALIRHGSTTLNQPGKLRGWLDIDLTPEGTLEAGDSIKIARDHWPGAKKLYSGDLKRHRYTADLIGKELQLAPVYTMNLRPWNAGALAGSDSSPNVQKAIQFYIKHPQEIPKGGEPMAEFVKRLIKFMTQVFIDAQNGVSPVICVTSIRPIEATRGWLDCGMRDDKISGKALEAAHDSVKPGQALDISWNSKTTFKNWKETKITGEKNGGSKIQRPTLGS